MNAGNAIEANAYLDADGNAKPKFELDDDPERTGVYHMGFDVVNLSDVEQAYTLDVCTLTESATGGRVNPDHTHEYLMEQFAYQLNPQVDAPKTVTVGANAKTHVDITISLSNADVQYMEKYFENGIYVEGFVTLTNAEEDGVDLSAPFMGFYGDWTDAPAIESNFFYDWPTADYPANTTLFANTVYTYDENKNETWFLGDTRSGNGQTPYGVQIGSKMMYWDERNAISPQRRWGAGLSGGGNWPPARVKEYRYVITDAATGEELYRKDMGYIPKAYYSANYDDIVTAGMYSGNELDFDWTTLENNQKVIVRMEAVTDIAGNEKTESWEFPVTCDTQAPVSSIRLYRSGNRYYVQNKIEENRFVDYTSIYAYLDNGQDTHYKLTYGGYDPAGREANITLGFGPCHGCGVHDHGLCRKRQLHVHYHERQRGDGRAGCRSGQPDGRRQHADPSALPIRRQHPGGLPPHLDHGQRGCGEHWRAHHRVCRYSGQGSRYGDRYGHQQLRHF